MRIHLTHCPPQGRAFQPQLSALPAQFLHTFPQPPLPPFFTVPPPTRPKTAGVLCPVFALRAPDDLGIGDTASVRELIDWAARSGLRLVQLLPINAIGGDNSPYNAISSVALEPLTLDLRPSRLPDLLPADSEQILARYDLDALRSGPVQYDHVRALKNALLTQAFETLTASASERRAAFDAFCTAESSWLPDFCLFRVLMEEHGHEDWTSWSDDFNTAAKARDWLAQQLGSTQHRLDFHAYTQWLAYQQWEEVRDYARSVGVKLMGDVPFGINYCSADVFFHPEQFILDWCGGAPPETYFKDDLFVQKWGQNWGIPLYDWPTMKADGYAWWRQRIQKLCIVFDVFRIDHVLGFYRIYSFPWRPQRNAEFLPLTPEEAAELTGGRLPHFIEHDDESDESKAANLAQGDLYLRMILDAAGGSEVIAEDLGTVPDYVRPHLLSLDIPGFKISHWEDDGNGHAVQGKDYPECSFTTYATHDHQPMKTHWDQRCREADSQAEETRAMANRELRFLTEFAHLWEREGHWTPYNDGIRRALLEGLFASNSRYAVFMITDLFGMEDRFNVPGIAGAMNWSARLTMTVPDLSTVSPYAEETDWLRQSLLAHQR